MEVGWYRTFSIRTPTHNNQTHTQSYIEQIPIRTYTYININTNTYIYLLTHIHIYTCKYITPNSSLFNVVNVNPRVRVLVD